MSARFTSIAAIEVVDPRREDEVLATGECIVDRLCTVGRLRDEELVIGIEEPAVGPLAQVVSVEFRRNAGHKTLY